MVIEHRKPENLYKLTGVDDNLFVPLFRKRPWFWTSIFGKITCGYFNLFLFWATRHSRVSRLRKNNFHSRKNAIRFGHSDSCILDREFLRRTNDWLYWWYTFRRPVPFKRNNSGIFSLFRIYSIQLLHSRMSWHELQQWTNIIERGCLKIHK